MGRFQDLTGRRFGKLVVIERNDVGRYNIYFLIGER